MFLSSCIDPTRCENCKLCASQADISYETNSVEYFRGKKPHKLGTEFRSHSTFAKVLKSFTK